MPGLTRKTFKLFGGSGTLSNFGQFGSKQAGLPQTSLDPTVIQQLAAWLAGWSAAISGTDKAPYLQDMNGVMYVFSYMTAYLYQMGIPEWDTGTTYYTNSVVQANNGQWFKSLQDSNLGNAPPVGASNAFWEWVNAPPVVPQAVAVGTIIDHAGGPTPTGYLLCDGSAVSRTTYAALFAQIGVIWGAGDSITTFNVPPLSRRVLVGSGGSGTSTLGSTVGSLGGAETHTLTIAQMPSHNHGGGGIGASVTGPEGGGAPMGNGNTGFEGGGGAHNNMQPSAVVLKLIKT